MSSTHFVASLNGSNNNNDTDNTNTNTTNQDNTTLNPHNQPYRVDCRWLVQAVADQEDVYQSTQQQQQQQHTNVAPFGHPEPPQILVFPVTRPTARPQPLGSTTETHPDAPSPHHTTTTNTTTTITTTTTSDWLFVVAYTPHFVFAQCFSTRTGDATSPPQPIGHLGANDPKNDKNSNEDEHVTALTVVSLWPSDQDAMQPWTRREQPHGQSQQQSPDTDTTVVVAPAALCSSESSPGTTTSPRYNVTIDERSPSASKQLLIKGVMSLSHCPPAAATTTTTAAAASSSSTATPATTARTESANQQQHQQPYHHHHHPHQQPPGQLRLAVVMGTNTSRVYTVEVQLHTHTGELLVDHKSPLQEDAGNKKTKKNDDDYNGNDEDEDYNDHSPTGWLCEVLPRQAGWLPHSYHGGGDAASSNNNNNNYTTSRTRRTTTLPFAPTGGVVSLHPHRLGRGDDNNNNDDDDDDDNNNTGNSTSTMLLVWIVYRDGTMVRLPAAGFFPSVWRIGAALQRSVEQVISMMMPPRTTSRDDSPPKQSSSSSSLSLSLSSSSLVVRCRLHFPGALLTLEDILHANDQDFHHYYNKPGQLIVPLPRAYPSPIFNFMDDSILWKGQVDSEEDDDHEEDDNSDEEQDHGGRKNDTTYEALVFGGSSSPTLTVYTSEVQFISRGADRDTDSVASSDQPVLGAVMDGTKALMGSVLGTALGALRWTVGATASRTKPATASGATGTFGGDNYATTNRGIRGAAGNYNDEGVTPDRNGYNIESSPFPSLCQHSIDLVPGQEIHDAPRQVEFCSIDPDGKLAAAADTLGRVILIDLRTKQIIRIWKGFRDARCYWIQSPHRKNDGGKTIPLYLAIHSRQRRVLEVWPIRHGPRVVSIPLNQGAELIPALIGSHPSLLATCFLLQSRTPGSSFNHLEEVTLQQPTGATMALNTMADSSNRVSANPSSAALAATPMVQLSSRETALRLQHLRQMLATQTASFTAQEVYQALREIKSLSDLATALDLLATSDILETNLGVQGTSFQRMAVAYCNEVLDAAIQSGNPAAIRTNPNVALLRRKIAYHTQVRQVVGHIPSLEHIKTIVFPHLPFPC